MIVIPIEQRTLKLAWPDFLVFDQIILQQLKRHLSIGGALFNGKFSTSVLEKENDFVIIGFDLPSRKSSLTFYQNRLSWEVEQTLCVR